jgi:hypothetical protein
MLPTSRNRLHDALDMFLQNHSIVDIIKEQLLYEMRRTSFRSSTQRTLTAPKGCGLEITTQLLHIAFALY